jgi:hypothetical protein
MKKIPIVTATLLLAVCATPAQSAKHRLSDLNWLAGCWASRDAKKDLMLTEQWMRPEGGLMLGMGRTVKGGRAADWEHMRIEQRGDDVLFIALPKGNDSETEFKLVKAEKARAVFENATHDFPQRVIYALAGPRKLAARVEGVQNGMSKGIDFPMDRVPCP